jgi:transcriptional regulator with XRE-family HTH domain
MLDAKSIIEALGGTAKVAGICGVSPQAVSQWKTKGIPKPWLKFLQSAYPKVFKIKAEA